MSGLSEEEKQEFLESVKAEESADNVAQMAAILEAVTEVDQEEKKRLVADLIKSNDMSEEDKKELVDKYMAEAQELEENYKNQQEYSNAVVAAKLAAKKRIRDEKLREAALKKELDALSAKQVRS